MFLSYFVLSFKCRSTWHLGAMAPWAPLVCDRFLGFSCFYGFLRIASQMFYRMSLNWNLSDAFLTIRLRLWVLRGGPQRWSALLIASYWGHALSPGFSLLVLMWITGLKAVCLVPPLHDCCPPLSLPLCALCKDVTELGTHLWSGESCSTSCEAEEHLHTPIVLHGRVVSSSLFINLVNHLYQYELMDIHFILWVTIQYW